MAKKQTPLDALIRAIEVAGSQKELADRISSVDLPIGQSGISNWIQRLKRVPAERVLAVEQAVDGKVSRYELRPDIYPREERAA